MHLQMIKTLIKTKQLLNLFQLLKIRGEIRKSIEIPVTRRLTVYLSSIPLRVKRRSVYVILSFGRGMPASALLNLNECCPSILLILDRKGHKPVMSSIVV